MRPRRLPYIENLRLALIVLVVAHHAVEPYASKLARWTVLPDDAVPGLWSVLWVNAAFFMGLFFFISGLFTPRSYDRRGPRAFARARAIRLGIPLLLGAFFLIPMQAWFRHLAYREFPAIGYWDYFTDFYLGMSPRPPAWPRNLRFPDFELGHLWFLEHLWIYAGLYVLWRTFVPVSPTRCARKSAPGNLAIACYAVVLAAVTWTVRVWYPQDLWVAFLGFIQVEPAHWPQYASLFVLGLCAGRNAWLESMPTRRGLGWLMVGGTLASAVYVGAAWEVLPTWSSQRILVCAWEASLCTALCVGLPVAFREAANHQGRLLHGLSSAAFAVYIFHFPVVMLLQWALIDSQLGIPARILLTVAGGVVLSFALSHAVLLWVPGARRVLAA